MGSSMFRKVFFSMCFLSIKIFLTISLFLTIPASSFAVSEAGVLFLIDPSPRTNAMAGASQASFNHSPTSSMMNPAHAAFLVEKKGIIWNFIL